MNSPLIEYVKRRHAFNLWQGRTTLDENLFVWNFLFSGREFPGWQPDRIERIEFAQPLAGIKDAVRPAEVVEEYEEGLLASARVLRAFWKSEEGRPGALLRVDVFECASRAAAHEFLVHLLGEFQSSLIERRDDLALGDVAFAGSSDGLVLFARGNLVYFIRNAGRDVVPVIDLAMRLDQELVRKPEAAPGRVMQEVRRVKATAAPVALEAVRAVEAFDLPEGGTTYKFFSRSGEVQRKEGHLMYQPTSNEPHEITVSRILTNALPSDDRRIAQSPDLG